MQKVQRTIKNSYHLINDGCVPGTVHLLSNIKITYDVTKFQQGRWNYFLSKGKKQRLWMMHGLLRPLGEFVVEGRLEPIKTQGLPTVLGSLLHVEKSHIKAKGKSGWSEISRKKFPWRRCVFSLYISICACFSVQAPIMLYSFEKQVV